jgi:beta-glucosidase
MSTQMADQSYKRLTRTITVPPEGATLGYEVFRDTELGYDSTFVEGPDEGRVMVRVELRNSGQRRGREVVQVYLSRPDSALDRPVRWLAGHCAVDADPGEKATVEITIPHRAFAHWDTGTSSWAVEPGTFQVQIGRSVADLVSSTPVVL